MNVRVVQGAAASATWTAALALVAQTHTQRRTAMMGLAMLGGNAGSVLGPIVGGLLLGWGGIHLALTCAGVLVGIDLVLRLTLLVEPPRLPGERPDLLSLLRDPAVPVAGWVVVVGVGGWGLLEPLLSNHLTRTAAAAPWAIGLMLQTAFPGP
jgi:MFS family permease